MDELNGLDDQYIESTAALYQGLQSYGKGGGTTLLQLLGLLQDYMQQVPAELQTQLLVCFHASIEVIGGLPKTAQATEVRIYEIVTTLYDPSAQLQAQANQFGIILGQKEQYARDAQAVIDAIQQPDESHMQTAFKQYNAAALMLAATTARILTICPEIVA